MSITAECPACGEVYKLNDATLGKTLRCKECKAPFTVGADRPRRRAASARDDDEREVRDDRPRRRSARSAEAASNAFLKIALVVVGCVLALGLLSVGVVFFFVYRVTQPVVAIFDNVAEHQRIAQQQMAQGQQPWPPGGPFAPAVGPVELNQGGAAALLFPKDPANPAAKRVAESEIVTINVHVADPKRWPALEEKLRKLADDRDPYFDANRSGEYMWVRLGPVRGDLNRFSLKLDFGKLVAVHTQQRLIYLDCE
jgi:hypothetical protein